MAFQTNTRTITLDGQIYHFRGLFDNVYCFFSLSALDVGILMPTEKKTINELNLALFCSFVVNLQTA